MKKNGKYIISPYMHEIKQWEVDVSCFNIPPDISNLQEFQRNLKPMADFDNEQTFINYYIEKLKYIFAQHSTIDPSITTSFDLYIQSSKTGNSLALYIPNHALAQNIPDGTNYYSN